MFFCLLYIITALCSKLAKIGDFFSVHFFIIPTTEYCLKLHIIQKISNIEIVDEFIKTWSKLKSFFISIFDLIQKQLNNFTSKFKNIFSFFAFKFPKIGNLFASNNSNQKCFGSLSSDKITGIRRAASMPTTRNQNNNFNITIN